MIDAYFQLCMAILRACAPVTPAQRRARFYVIEGGKRAA